MQTGMTIPAPAPDAGQHTGGLSLLDRISLLAAAIILGVLIYGFMTKSHGEAATTSHAAAAPAEHVEHAGTAHDSSPSADHEGVHAPPQGYAIPPIWACIPFVAILLSIALLPLIPSTAHWWEQNRNRLAVSLVLAAVTLLYYGFVHPMTYDHTTGQTFTGLASVQHVLEHAILIEYIPFIVLLFSLYVISGGIALRGDLVAHPSTNTAFLAAGGALASFIGTTGASMLLIRPLLQTNRERRHKVHTVVFFIFVVSNCGGLLLPIGDPPLFLGYLRGVRFLWTLNLVWEWLVVCGALLIIYFLWDRVAYRKETPADHRRDETQVTRLTLTGKINFLYLVGIVLCVGLIDPNKKFPGTDFTPFPFMRELFMLFLVWLSRRTTDKNIYRLNNFDYHAITEVAVLFVGIFVCMQVPIEILHQKGGDLGLQEPWHFFWSTGILSAFLDNAPTYVVFFETARVLPSGSHAVEITGGTINAELLTAISLGAVFMGAMTYIGNGPNFMVKSIAEQRGVRMPSFFGYMLYSCAVLLPLLALVTIVFLL